MSIKREVLTRNQVYTVRQILFLYSPDPLNDKILDLFIRITGKNEGLFPFE